MRGYLGILLVLFAAGCTTTSETPPIADRYWQLEGKLSVSFEGKTRVISMNWRQTGDSSSINLRGPFGAGEADVLARGDEIRVDTGEGFQHVDPDQFMATDDRSLYLPWQNLSYWIRGQTGATGSPLPDVSEQGEWRITVIRRNAEGPELMTFEHPDIALRLRIQSLSGII